MFLPKSHFQSLGQSINSDNSSLSKYANLQLSQKQNIISKEINIDTSIFKEMNQNCILTHDMNNESNQYQDFQNFQDQKFSAVIDFIDIDQQTYRMITQKKGKYNKITKEDLNEKQQENFGKKIGIIFQNDSSLVNLFYNFNLNKFVVTKQQDDQQIFMKEHKILEQLKGTNVTLDVISQNYQNYQIQQIAGKTNLQLLKQKTREHFIFDVFYFILLDKLNRMHELGIAHSDIKPQNIVISYDNEPFFIDFGSSIDLSKESDFQNYLNSFTPNFNLRIYFEKFNPRKQYFKTKKFTSKDEIKLCDRTQLSLTFLNLFCIDQDEINLFNSKNYDKLIDKLFQKCQKEDSIFTDQEKFKSRIDYMQENRKIVLLDINRTLNQADPTIGIINKKNINEQRFFIEEMYIEKALLKSNDIIVQGQTYIVWSIDKFSILLIYFLDKLNLKLKIDPKNMFITPLPEIKEYEYLSEKYKINEYFQNLVNARHDLNINELYNILQYLITYKIQKHEIIIENSSYFNLFFQIISNSILNPFELFIQFDQIFLETFIQYLNQYRPKVYIKSFEIFENKIICQVIKDYNNQKIPCVQIKYHILTNKSFLTEISQIKKNKLLIKQLELSYRGFYNYTDEIENKENNIIENIGYLVKQMQKQYTYPQSILFERSLNEQINSIDQESEDNLKQQLQLILQCKEHEIHIKDDITHFIKKDLEQLQKQSYGICSKCEKNIEKIKYYLSLQVEQLTCEILRMEHTTQKITIKIFDYSFEQINMWHEIKNYIETQNNDCYFKLILVNCKINANIAEIVKEIKIIQDYKVKIVFKKSIELYENEYDYLKYELFIEQNNEQSHEQGFEIIFIEEFTLKEQIIKQNKTESKQIITTKGSQRIETEKKEEKIYKSDEIHQIFQQNEQFQFIDLKELKMNYINQQNITEQKVIFFHVYRNHWNQKNIDYLIENINKKKYYSEIHLFDEQDPSIFPFYFICFNKLQIEISSQKNQSEILSQVYELYLSIYRNYYINNDISFYSQREINIKLSIDYQYCKIIQQIRNEKDKGYQDMIQFFGIDIRQNFINIPDQKYDQFILQKYKIDLNDKGKQLFENLNIQDEFNERDIYDKFNNIFFHLNQCSLINSKIKSIVFENEEILLKFQFKYIFIEENCFKILIDSIEKIFPQNKIYTFKGYRMDILQDIYQIIKSYKLKNKLYLDFTKSQISYDQFYQLIQQIQQDKNYQFIFKIKNKSHKMESKFSQDFKDILEIYDMDEFIIAQFNQPNYLQIEQKTIYICLEFYESNLNQTSSAYKFNLLQSFQSQNGLGHLNLFNQPYKVQNTFQPGLFDSIQDKHKDIFPNFKLNLLTRHLNSIGFQNQQSNIEMTKKENESDNSEPENELQDNLIIQTDSYKEVNSELLNFNKIKEFINLN